MVDGLVVEVLGRDDGLDDVLHEVSRDLLVGDVLGVLGGDNDGVDALGDRNAVLKLVLTSDLGLSVGADPVAGAVLAHLGQLGAEGGSKHVGEGHQLLGLIRGITKHNTLIASANVLNLDGINRLGNVGALLLNGDNDVAGLVIKALCGVVVANVADSVTDNLLVVDSGLGRDLTEDHDHASLAAGLASNTRGLVSSDAGIKDGIRDLITELVGMALIDGL
mmetsp:Transcript_11903/g.24781  ORF Transcript_11903/g.24781 Transcript_11903/m.24781 type:complete len:221 (+) Transcript_11903:965-1627(+)